MVMIGAVKYARGPLPVIFEFSRSLKLLVMPISDFTGSGHLVPKNSRTHFFNHLVRTVRDGGTRWHLAVENSTGWYEVAGIIFRLVRVGWQKFPAGTR